MIRQVNWATAATIAQSMPRLRHPGCHHGLSKVVGADTWPDQVTGGAGAVFEDEDGMGAVVWVEPDTFNSKCFGVKISRVHYRISRPCPNFALAMDELTNARLITARLVGHQDAAVCTFRGVGWALTATNLVFYRRRGKPLLQRSLPEGIHLRFHDLFQEPLSSSEQERFAQLAEDNFFVDRFSLDPCMELGAVRKRFGRVIRGALSGQLVDQLITATDSSGAPAGMIFFGIDRKQGVAGRWLTAFVKPAYRHHLLGRAMFAELIRAPRYRGLAWTYCAYLGNFDSVEAYHELGFRIVCATWDMHFWRSN